MAEATANSTPVYLAVLFTHLITGGGVGIFLILAIAISLPFLSTGKSSTKGGKYQPDAF